MRMYNPRLLTHDYVITKPNWLAINKNVQILRAVTFPIYCSNLTDRKVPFRRELTKFQPIGHTEGVAL